MRQALSDVSPHQNFQPYAFPYSITHHRHGPVFLILKVGHLSSYQIMVSALPIMWDIPGVLSPQETHKAGHARRSSIIIRSALPPPMYYFWFFYSLISLPSPYYY